MAAGYLFFTVRFFVRAGGAFAGGGAERMIDPLPDDFTQYPIPGFSVSVGKYPLL